MLINSFKVLFFFLLLIEGFYAQDEIYRNYTVEDGLPSSEVYYSFQDSKGYMWFATDAGVSRFNGYEFESFTTENGLTDNTVFKITEDSRGRIWFAPFNGRFCYYDGDTIIEPLYLRRAVKQIGSLDFIQSFYVDSLDNLWVGSVYYGIFSISKKGTVRQMIVLPKSQALRTKAINVEGEVIVGNLLSPIGSKILLKQNLTSLLFFKDTLINEDQPLIDDHIRGVYRLSANKELICYFKGNSIFIIDKDFRSVKVDIPILNENLGIYVNVQGPFIYVGIENNGIYKYLYKEGKCTLITKKLITKSISSVCIDKSEGVWYTTLSNGVYYLPVNAISKSLLESEQVYDMKVDKKNKKLYVSLRNGNLLEITDSIKKIEQLTKNFLSIYFNDNALYWFGLEGFQLNQYKGGKVSELKMLKNSIHFKSMIIKNEKMYFVDNMGLNIVTDTSWYSSYHDKESKLWCTSLAFHSGKLWVGTNEGVKELNNGILIDLVRPLNYSITSMLEIDDSTLIIGTKGQGIFYFEKGKLKKNINKEQGLVSNIVRCLHKDNKGVIWCGTNKGVTRITKKNSEFICYNITNKNGLISEEIRSIKSIKDTLFIGSTRGVLVIRSNELEPNEYPPNLFFKSLLVNSIGKTVKEIKLLKHNENNISIEYLGINYRSQGEVNYKYRLIGEGTDTNWLSTNSRSVQYTLLPPSDYLFEVKAENEDGLWSNPIKKYFSVYPPYWKTWWFISFIVISFILLLFWAIYLVFKRRETKIKIEKKLIELELKALRSQMNPHFIFNILNSIQHFMLQNNFKETNHYLTQFAKLIRTVLNLSEKNIITIGEELEMLKLYMNLEKMRFENGFDYDIILGSEIDEDYDEIPSMLIQPYIENAIWHGLMNKKSKGKIVIKLDIVDDFLFCSVNDNGIGREKAKEIKLNRKMKHKSVGMRITKDRLELLNSETDVNVEIIDKVDKLNNALGTEVKIKVKYVN